MMSPPGYSSDPSGVLEWKCFELWEFPWRNKVAYGTGPVERVDGFISNDLNIETDGGLRGVPYVRTDRIDAS